MDVVSVSAKTPLTPRQKIMIVVLALTICFGGMSFSVSASFLPQNVFTKGLTSTDVGIILSMFSLAIIILAFIFNYLITFTGGRFMNIASIFVCSGSLIPFAFVMHAKPGAPFYVSCMLCRFMQGVGYAGIQISSLSIVTQEFSDYLSTFVGVVEMASGVGFAIGPSLGGIVYDIVGFEVPFFIVAGILLVLNIISFFTIKPQSIDRQKSSSNEKNSSVSLVTLIKIPELLIPMSCCCLSMLLLSFIDISLGPHFTVALNSTNTVAGLGFGVTATIYAIGAVLVGYIVDKKNVHEIIVIAGCLFGIVAFLIYGPTPKIGLDLSIPLLMVSAALIGLSSALVYVPALEIFLNIIRKHDIKVDQTTNNFASSCVVFSSNLGNLLGPVVGGLLIDKFDIPLAGFVFCIICAAMGIINLIHLIVVTINSRHAEEHQFLLK